MVLALLLLFGMFQNIAGSTRSIISTGGGGCTGVSGTHRDCFTTNPLSANWTQGTAGGYVNMVSTGTGTAHPTVSGDAAYVVFTGATFSANQQSQVIYNTWTNAGASGPAIRLDAAGDGFLYVVAAQIVIDIQSGSGIATVISGCPAAVDSHVYQLIINGTNMTCADTTAGTSSSATGITAHPTGNPGFLVDQGTSTSIVANKWGGS